MNGRTIRLTVLLTMIGGRSRSDRSGEVQQAVRDSLASDFNVDKADLMTSGRNPHFVLE